MAIAPTYRVSSLSQPARHTMHADLTQPQAARQFADGHPARASHENLDKLSLALVGFAAQRFGGYQWQVWIEASQPDADLVDGHAQYLPYALLGDSVPCPDVLQSRRGLANGDRVGDVEGARRLRNQPVGLAYGLHVVTTRPVRARPRPRDTFRSGWN